MSLKWLAQIYMDQSDPPQPYVFANILKSFFFFCFKCIYLFNHILNLIRLNDLI